MGAEFVTATLSGDLSKAELENQFRELQENDLFENGHSYSGGFGMCSGLQIRSDLQFDRTMAKFGYSHPDPADEWLADHCEKWKAAIAVKVTNEDGTTRWHIGAWCAS